MKRISVLFAMFVCVAMVGGCGSGAGAATGEESGVGVIDLDRLVELLGRRDVIEQKLTERAEQASAELRQRAGEIQRQAQQEVQQITGGSTGAPTQAQQQQIAAVSQRMQAEIGRLRMEVVERRNEIRQEVRDEFKAEVLPVAEQVSARLSLDIVLVRSDQVLLFDPAIDITMQVSDAMQ